MAENVGSIEYTLKVSTKKAIEDLKRAINENEELRRSFGDTDRSANRFNATMTKTAQAVRAVAAGSTALTAGVLAANIAMARMVATVSSQIKEMDVLAERAGMNAQAFQALSHASSTVSVSMDELSQTIKDTNDRVGQLTGEGMGELEYAFKRFLTPAGITIEKLREMAGQDVLISVVKAMEDAGASAGEMTSALEMVASNASHLLPLLKDNGAAIKQLSKEASDMGVIISQENVDQAKEFDRQWKLLGGQITNFKNIMAIGLTPAMEEFVNYARSAVNWMDQLFNVSRNSQIKNLESEIDKLSKAIDERVERGAKKYGDVSIFDALTGGLFSGDTGDTESMRKRLSEMRDELAVLLAERDKISKEIQKPMRSDVKPSAYVPYKEEGLGKEAADKKKEEDSARQSAIDKTQSFVQLGESELDRINREELEKIALIENYRSQELINLQLFEEAKNAIMENAAKQRISLQDAQTAALLTSSSEMFDGMSQLVGAFSGEQSNAYKALFAVSKGFAIANAALQLQTAIANASALPYPANIPAIGQAVALGGQIASSIGSLSYSGGRATGGFTGAGQVYQLGEGNRPEVWQTGGKLFGVSGDGGRVFNGSQLDKIGGNAPNVIINNYSGAQATQTTNQNGDIEITIGELVNQMDNHSGSFYDALTRNTNVSAKL